MAQIPPQFIESLSIVLGKLFQDWELNAVMLKVSGDGLHEVWVGQGLPIRRTAFELLQRVNESGIAEIVLAEMAARRPASGELSGLILQALPSALVRPPREDIRLSAQKAGVPVVGLPDDAFAPGLQKNVRPNLTKLDIMVWIDRLVMIRNRVCRVEISDQPAGTGFLVGPQVVLTNWHVVQTVAAAGRMADVGCRFDYVRLPDGSRQPGVVAKLADPAILASCPYSRAELTDHPDDPLPEPGELDFALLHLAEPAGDQPVDAGQRGWETLPDLPFALARDAPLLIVQHPDGAPMKLAMDTQSVIGSNANGTRVLYRTNTENGASGAPCFSMDWDLVLLHHYGDPAWRDPKFNQGVPLDLIRQKIVAAGHEAQLGR